MPAARAAGFKGELWRRRALGDTIAWLEVQGQPIGTVKLFACMNAARGHDRSDAADRA